MVRTSRDLAPVCTGRHLLALLGYLLLSARLCGINPATFVFRLNHSDSEFEQLNNLIEQAANANPGYLGKERWINSEEQKHSVIYYWESRKSLKEFSRHPVHQKAKQQYTKWDEGYEILIAEVSRFASDHGL